jgi:hypothetical protein
MTPIFKPKKGPILRWSRLLHFAEAVAATTLGGIFGGDAGMAYAGAGAIAGGFGWEALNSRFPKGKHMFGDGWDFLAFVAGALATAVVKTGIGAL